MPLHPWCLANSTAFALVQFTPVLLFNTSFHRLGQMGDVWQLEDPDAKYWNIAFLHWHVGSWLASWLAPLLASWLAV